MSAPDAKLTPEPAANAVSSRVLFSELFAGFIVSYALVCSFHCVWPGETADLDILTPTGIPAFHAEKSVGIECAIGDRTPSESAVGAHCCGFCVGFGEAPLASEGGGGLADVSVFVHGSIMGESGAHGYFCFAGDIANGGGFVVVDTGGNPCGNAGFMGGNIGFERADREGHLVISEGDRLQRTCGGDRVGEVVGVGHARNSPNRLGYSRTIFDFSKLFSENSNFNQPSCDKQ